MTEQEIREIYNRLVELTKARMVHWKRTDEAEYTVSFSRSSVVIQKEYGYEALPTVLRVYNAEGVLVAYAAPIEIDAEEAVKGYTFDPSELFDIVQEEVYKYTDTSKNILDELRELELSQRNTQ
jgi:hypothetical protein